jgi:hypothetical protein
MGSSRSRTIGRSFEVVACEPEGYQMSHDGEFCTTNYHFS